MVYEPQWRKYPISSQVGGICSRSSVRRGGDELGRVRMQISTRALGRYTLSLVVALGLVFTTLLVAAPSQAKQHSLRPTGLHVVAKPKGFTANWRGPADHG